jgi:hypothetical protein
VNKSFANGLSESVIRSRIFLSSHVSFSVSMRKAEPPLGRSSQRWRKLTSSADGSGNRDNLVAACTAASARSQHMFSL